MNETRLFSRSSGCIRVCFFLGGCRTSLSVYYRDKSLHLVSGPSGTIISCLFQDAIIFHPVFFLFPVTPMRLELIFSWFYFKGNRILYIIYFILLIHFSLLNFFTSLNRVQIQIKKLCIIYNTCFSTCHIHFHSFVSRIPAFKISFTQIFHNFEENKFVIVLLLSLSSSFFSNGLVCFQTLLLDSEVKYWRSWRETDVFVSIDLLLSSASRTSTPSQTPPRPRVGKIVFSTLPRVERPVSSRVKPQDN